MCIYIVIYIKGTYWTLSLLLRIYLWLLSGFNVHRTMWTSGREKWRCKGCWNQYWLSWWRAGTLFWSSCSQCLVLWCSFQAIPLALTCVTQARHGLSWMLTIPNAFSRITLRLINSSYKAKTCYVENLF